MKYRMVLSAGLVAALAAAPVSPARAHGYDHFRGGGPLFWPFAAVAAVVTGAAILVTAPLRAVAGPPGYYEEPRYYAPPQVDYRPAPDYYEPPPGYYAPPQAYYRSAPAYYTPPVGYVIRLR